MLTLSNCQRRQDHATGQQEDFVSALLNVSKRIGAKSQDVAAQTSLSNANGSTAETNRLAAIPMEQPSANPPSRSNEAGIDTLHADNLKGSSPAGETGAVDKTQKGLDLFNQAKEALSTGNIEQSKELYLESCAAGYLYGCHRFGWHQNGLADRRGAMQFYTVACRAGFWKSCNNLGWIAEKEKHYEKAADYYSWACLHKHPGSCHNLQRVARLQQPAH